MKSFSDKQAFWLIGLGTAVLLGFIFWMTYVHQGSAAPQDWARWSIPANPIFNVGTFLCLVWGYFMIRQGEQEKHRRFMLGAVSMTVGFLLSYTIQHLFVGETRFGGQGLIRPIYFFILITHIVLSALITPFVMTILFFALTGRFDRHKKLARITFPIWLYVSVTGVAVYFFLSPYR
jgi:putative membrane protein